MTDSILDSVKEALGLPADQADFNGELIMHINSVLPTLNQLGVGPSEGFMITGSNETWAQLLGESPKFMDAMTYIFLRVKLVFDPPANPSVIDAMKEQITEAAWRMNVTRESTDYVDPDPDPVPDPV